jgi:hypothetical protein
MPQTWEMWQMFYFLSDGRHAEDFLNRKNPTASVGSEPEIEYLILTCNVKVRYRLLVSVLCKL